MQAPTSSPRPSARRPLGPWLLGLSGVLALLGLGRALPHAPWLDALLPGCPSKWLVGWPCPACGLTRVVVLLAHGDVVGALSLAPLPALAAVYAVVFVLSGLLATARGRAPPRLVPGSGRRLVRLVLLLGAALLWGYALWRSARLGAP